MTQPALGTVIVTGIPGAGKTTIARALAARASFGAHIDIDVIYSLVVDAIDFHRDSPAEDWWQLDLARENIGLLANSFARHGVLPVVVDVVPNRSVFDAYVNRLPGPVRFIVLTPSVEVVLYRDATRVPPKRVAEGWTFLAESMSRELRNVGLWLDTSDLDVDATLAAIQQRWDEAIVDPFK